MLGTFRLFAEQSGCSSVMLFAEPSDDWNGSLFAEAPDFESVRLSAEASDDRHPLHELETCIRGRLLEEAAIGIE